MVSDRPDFAAVTEYLFGLKAGVGPVYGIDRMRVLAEELGHPERGLPVVHVAGTNGKGSVSAMIEAILRTAGWHTGLSTSPHLVHLGERVQVDRRDLLPNEIAEYVAQLRPLAENIEKAHGAELKPAFFEMMTAMAFLQFRRQRCDIAVLEVGLGGRLDATNIVTPEVSVITSIGMDHCELLGHELTQIAREKAGVIKQGRPVVIGRMPPEAEQTIREIARERGAPLVSVRDVFGENLENYPTTNLEGDYQRWNAATATLAARAMDGRWEISDDVIRRGLQNVSWPGRWQRTQVGGRLLILDASHNPEGAQVLETNLAHLAAETGHKPIVITGVLGTVRAKPLIETICHYAKQVCFVVPQQPRACSFEELEALVPADFRGEMSRGDVSALFPGGEQCAIGRADDVIVVTGSIYLLGEVMARLQRVSPDQPSMGRRG